MHQFGYWLALRRDAARSTEYKKNLNSFYSRTHNEIKYSGTQELELFDQRNGLRVTLFVVQNEYHVVVVGDS